MPEVHIELNFRDWTAGRSARVRTGDEVVAEILELAALADGLAVEAAAEGVDYADLGRWRGDPPFAFRVEVSHEGRPLAARRDTAADATELGDKLRALAHSLPDSLALPGPPGAERSAA